MSRKSVNSQMCIALNSVWNCEFRPQASPAVARFLTVKTGETESRNTEDTYTVNLLRTSLLLTIFCRLVTVRAFQYILMHNSSLCEAKAYLAEFLYTCVT